MFLLAQSLTLRIGEADAKVGSRNPLHFLTEKAVAKVPCDGETKSGESGGGEPRCVSSEHVQL